MNLIESYDIFSIQIKVGLNLDEFKSNLNWIFEIKMVPVECVSTDI